MGPNRSTRLATESIRSVVISAAWEGEFDELWLGDVGAALRSSVARHVAPGTIAPRLLSRADFADLVGRPEGARATDMLYDSVVEGAARVRGLPRDAAPPRGAHADIPAAAPAFGGVALGGEATDDGFFADATNTAVGRAAAVHLDNGGDARIFCPRVEKCCIHVRKYRKRWFPPGDTR